MRLIFGPSRSKPTEAESFMILEAGGSHGE